MYETGSNLQTTKKFDIKKLGFLIAGIVLGLVYIFPIYILALNSFKTQKGLFENVLGLPTKSTFTLENYKNSFEKLNYFRSFFNSICITLASVALILLIASMASWVLVRYKTKMSKFIFILFSVATLIPFQCTMLPLLMVAKNLNLLNPAGLVFMYIGFGMSLSILMIHGFMKNIPEELEEAATIDGCNMFQLFFIIILPLLKIILITSAVLNIMWIWNDFLLPSLIINNKPEWRTLPLMTFSFFGEYSTRWDLATAALFMCIVPIILFYFWSQRYIVRGITDGAIK